MDVIKLIAARPLKFLFNRARLSATSMSKGWTSTKLIPEILDEVPPSKAKVVYESISLNEGTVVKPSQTKEPPQMAWKIEANALYTLYMGDPDAPSRSKSTLREWHHWLVVNIPENRVSEGEVLAEYIPLGPPKGTGIHRYLYLVYKQPGKLSCDEKKLPNNAAEGRANFSIKKFAEKYKLGKPIAGNFLQAEFDDFVITVHKQIGIIKD